jgi:hypothetical protein
MLIKQFLNDEEKNDILNFIETTQDKDYIKVPGFDASIFHILEHKNIFQFIANKINCYNKNYRTIWENSFIVKIKPNGFISVHIDDSPINCNILIQKPENGGDLLVENTKIITNEKDAYFLNPNKKHGISTITGNKCYYSVVICNKIIEKTIYDTYLNNR